MTWAEDGVRRREVGGRVLRLPRRRMAPRLVRMAPPPPRAPRTLVLRRRGGLEATLAARRATARSRRDPSDASAACSPTCVALCWRTCTSRGRASGTSRASRRSSTLAPATARRSSTSRSRPIYAAPSESSASPRGTRLPRSRYRSSNSSCSSTRRSRRAIRRASCATADANRARPRAR